MNERTKAVDDRRLINHLTPNPEWGPCRGFVETTYEFQPEFCETDYLPSLLGLGAWDDRHWTSRVAMERELSSMKAAVLMDVDGYRGRPRSLRVEVLPGRGQQNSRLHAKVTIIRYEKAVRLLVGSANVTEPGYRHNVEAMSVLTATAKRSEAASLIIQAIDGGRDLLAPWLSRTDNATLAEARDFLLGLTTKDAEPDEWFCWGGGPDPVWRQVLSRWPAEERISQIRIVSPFWSEDDGQGPLMTLLRELRNRDVLEEKASVLLVTDACPLTQTTWRPVFPRGYAQLPCAEVGVSVFAQAFDPRVLPEEVMSEDYNGTRRLHAKVVVMEGERLSLAYFGSANFTHRGWGFAGNGANIEAGLILLRRGQAREDLAGLIPLVVGDPIKLGQAEATSLAEPPDKAKQPAWPHFIRDLRLAPMSAEPTRLEIQASVEDALVKGVWAVSYVDDSSWTAAFVPAETRSVLRADLPADVLERLLRDQEVRVTWWGNPLGVAYPLNVHPDARDALPVSPDSRGPSEQMLLYYYQGRIAYEELFPPADDAQEQETGAALAAVPSEVDTCRIQSYQVREFVESLDGLREDLKNASASGRSMRLALLGPVSPVALGRMIHREVTSGGRSPTAGGFQLLEIVSCLLECKGYEHIDEWEPHLRKALTELWSMLDDLKTKHAVLQEARFCRYERVACPGGERREVARV